MKKFYYLSIFTLLLVGFVSCEKENKNLPGFTINMTQVAYSRYGDGTIQVPFTVDPANFNISDSRLALIIDHFALSKPGVNQGMPSINLETLCTIQSVKKGTAPGEWIATVKVATDELIGTVTVHLSAQAGMVSSESFTIEIKNTTFTLPQYGSVRFKDQTEWHKELSIPYAAAFEYFEDDFNVPGTLHLYDPEGNIWGESPERPAFCVAMGLSQTNFEATMVIDESDTSLFAGEWYWLLPGTLQDGTEVFIKIMLILQDK